MALELMVAIVLIMALTYLLTTLSAVPGRQQAARAAAAEAARSAILVEDSTDGPAVAEAMAVQVMANYEIPADQVRVLVEGDITPGEELTVHVTVTIPVIRFPGSVTYHAVEWTASSTELVEPYRSFGP